MKKILLFASAFALLTGCSKTEHAPDPSISQKIEGIVFNANLDVNTKGELYQDEETKAWKMFWYAEADKMDVYYSSVDPETPEATWSEVYKQSYKATRTLGEGYFAAVADAVKFEQYKNLSFRFVYPAGLGSTIENEELVVDLPEIKDQVQSYLSGSDAVGKIFMVGALDNAAPVYENNPAVADVLLNMQLRRPFPVAYFKLKNYDIDLYGELKSIKLESKGTVESTTGGVNKYEAGSESEIDYGIATYNVETGVTTIVSDPGAVLTVTVNGEWENDVPVYMVMNTVDRSANTKAEWMKISYVFENATFEEEKPLGMNVSFEAHKMYDMSNGGFDLAAQPYAVLGKTDATLLLNKSFKGSVESIVKGNAINTVLLSNITKIVSNVVLSQADMKYMGANFTALKEATLNENTEIPAFNIKDQILTKLIAPKVTTIDEKAFNAIGSGHLNLTDCILPSYDFEKVSIANALLKSAYLQYLDVSAVKLIATTFPATGLSLQNFDELIEVTVKSDVNVGTKAFDGCAKLAEVKFPKESLGASINLTGEYAFSGCELIESISISNTQIPAGAFAGCSELASVTSAGKAIAPTLVGAEAFKGTAIVNVDLSKATAIGKSAFEGCTKLVGVKHDASGVSVLRVDAITKLQDKTFSGCTALTYIGFANVEEVGTQFLTGTKCFEISFSKKITSATVAAGSFGTTGTTTLYVDRDQTGVDNATLTLNKEKFTFKAIKN